MASGSKNKYLDRYSFRTLAAKQRIERILEATSKKALCRNEIEKIAFVNHSHTRVYIKHLLDTKQIYVSKWKLETQGKRTMFWPYYSAGNRKSKPKPEALTASEKCKRYRKKLSKDDERRDEFNFRRRAKRIKAKSDWKTSWTINSSNGQRLTG